MEGDNLSRDTHPSAYGGSQELGPEDQGPALPTQGQSVVSPQRGAAVLDRERDGGGSGSFDLSYLAVRLPRSSRVAARLTGGAQELMAIQQSGPRNLGFFGTRNMGYLHQQLIEILAYAYVLTENHIFTSGATGTNAAVIRGALRAERPDLLTVVLPQSLARQPSESRELLAKVANVVETPENDGLALGEAARACNEDILRRVQQVICFAFHDSELLLETCQRAKAMQKPVALLFLD